MNNTDGESHSQQAGVLPFLKNPKLSRDEMNLAEFPLTVLSTRANPSLKTLEFKDTVKGKNGEFLERKWIITGADKFGLPTSSDDEVLLGLLKLTVEDGMQDRKIYFTRYELLKTLKWTTEGRSYVRLQKALDRLSGVRIKASNAFYDNDSKAHSTKNFGIIDAYEINTGGDPQKLSFFIWSETLFKSFQVGFIKKLDLEFYLGLESAVSKRLYRYLDKHFWYKSKVTIGLFTLAHEKVGISRTYQYASSIRQILDPAIDELKSRGFIASYEHSGKGKGCEVTFFATPTKNKIGAGENLQLNAGSDSLKGEALSDLATDISRLLMQRGVNQGQAERLVRDKSEQTLKRMSQIISYFDFLVSSQSKLINRSPTGFLYRAVENPEQFILPGEKHKRGLQTSQSSEDSSSKFQQQDIFSQGSAAPSQRSEAVAQPGTQSKESLYLTERKQAIIRYKEKMDPKALGELIENVESALSKIRNHLSQNRFLEAVQHGVEEKIAKKIQFPEFDRWTPGYASVPY